MTSPKPKGGKASTLKQDISAVAGLLRYGFCNPRELLSSAGPTLNELTFGLAGTTFDPKRDIGRLEGKVIFVTGGNAGLGKETILQLVHHAPERIYLGARNESKAREAIASIQEAVAADKDVDIRYIPLDLTSFASIKHAAEQFVSESNRLDILILNAGVMGIPAVKTEQGHEIQLGTNHVGHFLLTKLLLPTLLKTAKEQKSEGTDVRVITLSSLAFGLVAPSLVANFSDTEKLLKTSTWQRYGVSKAANILFASELARRYGSEGIMSVSVHPGVVRSNLYEATKDSNFLAKYGLSVSMPMMFRKVASGALNQLWAAAGARRDQLANGAYYTPVGIVQKQNLYVNDERLAARLWEWSEGEVSKAL